MLSTDTLRLPVSFAALPGKIVRGAPGAFNKLTDDIVDMDQGMVGNFYGPEQPGQTIQEANRNARAQAKDSYLRQSWGTVGGQDGMIANGMHSVQTGQTVPFIKGIPAGVKRSYDKDPALTTMNLLATLYAGGGLLRGLSGGLLGVGEATGELAEGAVVRGAAPATVNAIKATGRAVTRLGRATGAVGKGSQYLGSGGPVGTALKGVVKVGLSKGEQLRLQNQVKFKMRQQAIQGYMMRLARGSGPAQDIAKNPIVATETKPSVDLNPELASAPDPIQEILRNNVADYSQGPAPNGQFEFYNKFGIPHDVHKSYGSFEGVISPNYQHAVGADMDAARFIANTEGLMNVQDAEAILHPGPDSINGVPGVAISKKSGGSLSLDDMREIYDELNKQQIANGTSRLEFTQMPGGDKMFVGNFNDLPPDDFFSVIYDALDRLGNKHQAIRLKSNGAYIERGMINGAKSATAPGYTAGIRENPYSRHRLEPEVISDWVDNYLTNPRLKAYREAAQASGADPAKIMAQIRDAGDQMKAALGSRRAPGLPAPPPGTGAAVRATPSYIMQPRSSPRSERGVPDPWTIISLARKVGQPNPLQREANAYYTATTFPKRKAAEEALRQRAATMGSLYERMLKARRENFR